MTGGTLGYAYYPNSFPETDNRHGVVILDESCPGGSASPYNLGDTLVHELGHARKCMAVLATFVPLYDCPVLTCQSHA